MVARKTKVPEARRSQILAWLEQEGSLSIRELESRLGVSHMTVHRDLDKLSELHIVKKSRGGVILAPQNTPNAKRRVCAMCAARVTDRSEFIILRSEESQVNACCPHCGMLLLSEKEKADSVLARDFLHGRMVNAYQAYYVVESDVRLCCVPSMLCFTSRSAAEKFQRGFGGQAMTFSKAVAYLTETHKHDLR
jgi:DNA-binding Lrp family transcriptional regulator